ncbi:MAG: ABC transporter ATP-binding protein [Pedosphaera sp. Tous-C6FEB]|nr:MAG: ABC transporter ATP-binding protein [Pedosphaera sp. Tous-C6FEB]
MIRFNEISWHAGAFRLDAVSFTVPAGSYGVLMGRTGCGKTTLLEILCGLRQSAGGRVLIGERDVTALPPGERGIGYVPQDGAMFPTMTVREQIGFALKIRHWSAEAIAARVQELSGQLGVAHLLDRLPQNLSGGERQRVALGRALAAKPSVLLLDEPLSALDEDLRDELATLLKRVQRDLSLTALHITHSRHEAAQLADVRFRMETGQVTEVRGD